MSAAIATKTALPSACRRRESGSKNLAALSVGYGYKVSLAHHFWLLRSDPVSDEAAVVLGFFVIFALVANQVTGRNVAN